MSFYPLVVDLDKFEVTYYVIESNELALLHRTENCNGQYFAETVSHHQEIWARKVEISNQQPNTNILFKYPTSSPYNFITIVPVIYHRANRAYYHLYVPRYTPMQLKNGEVFSSLTFFLADVAMRVEEYIDIHDSEKTVLIVVATLLCCSCLSILLGGIWLGSRYFFQVRTVYVMRDINQEENRLGE